MRTSSFGRSFLVALVMWAAASCVDRPPQSHTPATVVTTATVSEPTSTPPATSVSAASGSTTVDSATTDSFRSTWSNGASIAWSKVTLPADIRPRQESGSKLLGSSFDLETEVERWWESDDHGHTWAAIPTPKLEDEFRLAEANGVPWVAVSPDGVGVTMGGATHRQVFARTWYEAPGDPTIHRFVGREWEQVDLLPFAPRSIPGLDLIGSWFADGAALDSDTWIVPMESMFRVPWGDYYGDPDDAAYQGDVSPWPIWNWPTQRLGISPPGKINTSLATLTVDLHDTGPPDSPLVVFRDAASGRVVHTVEAALPGWEPEAMLTALRGWGLDDLVLIVGNGDEVVAVRPPFPMGEEWGELIVVFKGAFYTYSYQLSTIPETPYEVRSVRLWKSEDGLQWSLVPLPRLRHGTPLDWVSLVAGPNALMMTIHTHAGASLWTSTDGSNWQQTSTDGQQGEVTLEDPLPTEFGWIWAGTDGGWVSEDGLDWERIDLPPGGGEFPTVDYVGDVYFFSRLDVAEESGKEVIWVGQYEPKSESSAQGRRIAIPSCREKTARGPLDLCRGSR